MRHRNLLITTLLLLALLTGGWGGVIVAAFCAHDAEQQPSAMAEDHDCCRVNLEQPTEHCTAADSSAPASHEAMMMDEMEATPPAITEHAALATFLSEQPTGACLHCVSRGGLPTTFIVAREPEQKRRGAIVAPPPALISFVSLAATYAPFPSARQHAPPELGARRHLLLNVFVI